MIAHAASNATCVAQGFLDKINEAVLFPLITLLLATAFLWFLYGGAKYIFFANESTERENGRKHMLYGIIGLVVMTSAFTILAIAANTLGVSIDGASRCNPDGSPVGSPDGSYGMPASM